MDFDLNWVLMGLPIAFVMGWLASRFDLRQMRLENRQAPKAYFKGLNFLLNEQQDQAIDAFIEAVQNDPDTSELHFALGNLFRRRGEYERAVRVHQHLLSRADISADDRHRAQHGLALDYLKAGLLDRAETALLALEGTRFEAQARLALLANYERSRDWLGAAQVAAKLEAAGQAQPARPHGASAPVRKRRRPGPGAGFIGTSGSGRARIHGPDGADDDAIRLGQWAWRSHFRADARSLCARALAGRARRHRAIRKCPTRSATRCPKLVCRASGKTGLAGSSGSMDCRRKAGK